MAAEQFQAFVVNMNDKNAIHNYAVILESLNEDDVEELPCTEKATFFCALAAAANVGAVLRNILRNEQPSERIIQYIPQFTLYRFAL